MNDINVTNDEEFNIEAVGLYLLMIASSNPLVRLFLSKCMKDTANTVTKCTIKIQDAREQFSIGNETDEEYQQVINEFLESFVENMTFTPGVNMQYTVEDGVGYITMGDKEIFVLNYIDSVVKITNIRGVVKIPIEKGMVFKSVKDIIGCYPDSDRNNIKDYVRYSRYKNKGYIINEVLIEGKVHPEKLVNL